MENIRACGNAVRSIRDGARPMRIERRNTTSGQSPYAGIDFRLTTSEIRNPDGSIVFRLENVEVPQFWSQVASDVLAQKYFRKAGVAARLKKVEEETVPSWLWRSVPDTEALALLPESERFVSELSAKQVFDRLAGCWTYWGWKGNYFSSEEDAQAFFDELRFMLAKQMVAPNSPQWFNTGLHWAYGVDGPGQGHYYVDCKPASSPSPNPPTSIRSRTPASSRASGRPRQRGRHHGPLGARGAPVQIRLRHRLQLLAPARRRRTPLRRRPLLRPDELPQDRRPRRRRHQERRHHAPRGQDGRGRCRPSRYRDLYRLEGEGGAEGCGSRHRLQDQPEAPQGGAEGLRQLRRFRRRLLRPREEPGAAPRNQARAPRAGVRQRHQAGDPVRQARLQGHRLPDLRHRLGFGSLPHGIRPELQQLGLAEGRFPPRRGNRRRLEF